LREKRLAKRTLTKAIERKRSAKAKLKSGAKKVRKKVRARKPPSTPVVETVHVDVVEEPVPGVTVVTEFEATEVVVSESSVSPEGPGERQDSPSLTKKFRSFAIFWKDRTRF
jgi:hypothetical protein